MFVTDFKKKNQNLKNI